MSIKPISIRIENKWTFCEVAFLVDRDDFLADILKARRLLGVKKLIPHTQEDLNKWYGEELDRALDKKFSSSKVSKEFSFPTTKSQIIKDKILTKYRKPPFFLNIIEAAIFCGFITDEDFSVTAYVQIIDPNEYVERYKLRKFMGYPKLAIVISPETKPEEVESIMRKRVPSEMEFFKQNYLKSKRNLTDTVSNIERDRVWYWLNHKTNPYDINKKQALDKKLGYYRIAQLSTQQGSPISLSGVRAAIDQYRDKLYAENINLGIKL